jgi:hypothetical protein
MIIVLPRRREPNLLEPSREIREKGQNDRPVDRWVPRCVERWWQVGPGVCVALNSKGF